MARDRTRPTRRRRVLRRAAGGFLVLLVAWVVATAWIMGWPQRDTPGHADAIVMLNGNGPRLDEALRLGWAHAAPNLVIARGSSFWVTHPCAPAIPGVTVTCFNPSPPTTRGEAEFVGRLAAHNHWRSIIVVSTRAQDTRARLRISRCFQGDVDVVTVPIKKAQWPQAIAHEWAGLAKALLLERGC